MAAVAHVTRDATAAIQSCERGPWSGRVWRCHGRKYAGDNADGSYKTTGRFNQGLDKFAEDQTWRALYTSLAEHVALGERIRHTKADNLRRFQDQRVSRLWLELHNVVFICQPAECGEPKLAGYVLKDLCQPADYGATHELAAVGRSIGEALLVPSCTRYPEGNLIIFPDRLDHRSRIVVEDSIDPDLYVDWDAV